MKIRCFMGDSRYLCLPTGLAILWEYGRIDRTWTIRLLLIWIHFGVHITKPPIATQPQRLNGDFRQTSQN